MTITLAAVYAPVAFMTGPHRQAVHRVRADPGRRGDRLGLRRADAVADDELEAAAPPAATGGSTAGRGGARGAHRGYRRTLPFALGRARSWCSVGWGVAGFASLLFRACRRSWRRPRTAACIIGIGIAPEGATKEFTDATRGGWRTVYKQTPRRRAVLRRSPASRWSTSVISFVRLTDYARARPQPAGHRRRAGAQAVRHPRHPRLRGQPALARAEPDREAGAVRHPDLAALRRAAAKVDAMLAEARTYPGLLNVDTDLKLNKPRARDRRRPRQGGESRASRSTTIGRTLETMLGGSEVTRFKRNGKQYDVIVQVGRRRARATRTTSRRSTCARGGRDDPAVQPRHDRARRWRPRS